jgi:hypothetical protein
MTLGGMFPPGYRVSRCKGYKKGYAWLRMKTIEVTGYNAKERTNNRLNTVSKGMRCNHNLMPKNVIFRNISLPGLKKG